MTGVTALTLYILGCWGRKWFRDEQQRPKGSFTNGRQSSVADEDEVRRSFIFSLSQCYYVYHISSTSVPVSDVFVVGGQQLIDLL